MAASRTFSVSPNPKAASISVYCNPKCRVPEWVPPAFPTRPSRVCTRGVSAHLQLPSAHGPVKVTLGTTIKSSLLLRMRKKPLLAVRSEMQAISTLSLLRYLGSDLHGSQGTPTRLRGQASAAGVRRGFAKWSAGVGDTGKRWSAMGARPSKRWRWERTKGMGKHGAETCLTHRLTHSSLQVPEGAPGGRVMSL